MEQMFSIKEILQSKKFQRDAPEKLKRLIPQSSLFLPMSPTEQTDREDRRPKPTITETKKENAA